MAKQTIIYLLSCRNPPPVSRCLSINPKSVYLTPAAPRPRAASSGLGLCRCFGLGLRGPHWHGSSSESENTPALRTDTQPPVASTITDHDSLRINFVLEFECKIDIWQKLMVYRRYEWIVPINNWWCMLYKWLKIPFIIHDSRCFVAKVPASSVIEELFPGLVPPPPESDAGRSVESQGLLRLLHVQSSDHRSSVLFRVYNLLRGSSFTSALRENQQPTAARRHGRVRTSHNSLTVILSGHCLCLSSSLSPPGRHRTWQTGIQSHTRSPAREQYTVFYCIDCYSSHCVDHANYSNHWIYWVIWS